MRSKTLILSNIATIALTVAVTVAVLIPLLGLPAHLTPSRAQENEPISTISVTGEALVRVVPDEVILTLGVQSASPNLLVAKQQNDDRTRAVLALAERYDIKPEHVQTDFVWIEPQYRNWARREIENYFIQKTIVFTLKDINKFEALLTDALTVGVDNVYGIDFRTTELRKHRDQARDLAIRAAREKAQAMAAALDQKIGKATSIHEDSSSWNSFYYWRRYWYGGSGGPQSQNVVQNVGGSESLSTDGTFAPGQISVTARVTVVFELLD